MFGAIDLGVPLTLANLKEIHKSPEMHRAWEIANQKYIEDIQQEIEINHKIKAESDNGTSV